MTYCVISAVYLPLMVVIWVAGGAECRDLRPSEHGLAYQSNSTGAVRASSPEMTTFFGGKGEVAAGVPPGPLTAARNASDTAWLRNVSGGGRKDHVRKGLVVATVACGATGVAFLVAAGLIFMVQYRRRRTRAAVAAK